MTAASPMTSRHAARIVDVTVVMPAMNRAHLIGRALDSITAQTVKPRRVIVVDDASTDDTVEVAKQHNADVVALTENGGSGPARNRGIEEADTTWIAFLDSDDAWLPDHLERVMHATGGHVLVGAPGRSEEGRLIGNASGHNRVMNSKTVLVPGDVLCTSGVVARRETLLHAGMFRPLRRAQDLDMWIRALELGSGLALGRPGFTYYVHEQQAIRDTALMQACFGEIVDWCGTRPWFTHHDGERAWARWHWDWLRAAQQTGDPRGVLKELGWFAGRPHTWATTISKIAERRRSRPPAAPRSPPS